MNQPKESDNEKFWTRKTVLQMIFVGIAGVAFLISLLAIVSTKLVH